MIVVSFGTDRIAVRCQQHAERHGRLTVEAKKSSAENFKLFLQSWIHTHNSLDNFKFTPIFAINFLKIIFPYLLLLDVSQQKAHGTCQSKWAGTRLSVTCGGDSSLLNFLVNIAINNTRTEESSIIRSSLRRVSVPASRTLPLPPLTVFIFPHNINASTFWVSGILPCIPLLGMLHWHCYYRGWFPSPHSQTD